jgi:hypothetical protein
MAQGTKQPNTLNDPNFPFFSITLTLVTFLIMGLFVVGQLSLGHLLLFAIIIIFL